MTRTNCLEPDDCQAKGAGHCRRCHMTQVAGGAASKAALADPEVRARMSAASKAAWADPEVRARMSAASKAALADPEVRARMSAAQRRRYAKEAVRQAHLPLFRKTVDRAETLFRQGEVMEVVVDALVQEARGGAFGLAVGLLGPQSAQGDLVAAVGGR